MKALKAKLTAILLSLGCFALCLGVGVAVAQPETAQMTAQAAVTTHNIGALTLHTNSQPWGGAGKVSNQLYLARADGGALPVSSWDYVFVHESGYGFKVNGVRKTPKEIKSTGDGFFWNFDALNAGDVITISGTFYCESQQTKYVIEKSTFTWNGTNWSVGPALDAYSSFTINEIGPANGCTDSVVYAYPINDGKPTIASWDHALTFFEGSGAGVCLNGERLSGWEIKQPGDFYIVLGKAAKAGDVLTIDGIFYNEDKAAKVVFNNSSLQYNGTSWVAYGTADSYRITKINGAGGCTSSTIYAYPLIENKPEIADWNNGFSFREGSGEGFMFNGDLVTGWELKQPGDFYMVLGREAVEGDVVTLDGIFYNSTLGAQIEFDESSLQYDGKTWIQYKEVNIAPTKIGKVKIGANSGAGAVYFDKASGAAFEVTDGTWAEKLTYKLGSGVGVRINGEQIVMDDIKIPNNIYVNLKTTAKEGDILSIGGEFYNESLNINYAIEESHFLWNGSAWEKYVKYTTYNVGKVKIGANSKATAVYFDKVSGAAFEATDGTWTEKLTYESGTGVTLNGTQINMGDIKIPNNLYVGLGATAQTGDVLVIGGTFYNENLAVKYVIEDSKFVWNGSAWVDLVYTTHEIGALNLHTNSQPWGGAGNVSNQLYLARADGKALPVLSWDVLFEIETAGTFKINGVAKTPKEIKSTDAGFFWNFDALSEGDIVTINGTVTCDDAAARYVITESQFLWNGSAWEKYVPPVEYTTYNVGKVKIGNGSGAGAVYFDKASGAAFEATDGTWTEKLTYESGMGVTLNGTQISMNDIKIPNNLYVGLGKTAKTGDVLVIGGTFYNEKLAVKYVIEDSQFVWNGSDWYVYFAEKELEYADTVTILDLGLGTDLGLSGTTDKYVTSTYIPSDKNDTGSIKFRFGYQSTNLAQGEVAIRLRGADWAGYQFKLHSGGIEGVTPAMPAIKLNNNQYYLIEIGAIDMTDGENVWIYVKIDGVMYFSTTVDKSTEITEKSQNDAGFATYADYDNPNVSLYFGNVAQSTISDPDHVSVGYTTSAGTYVDYALVNGTYKLSKAKGNDVFLGWVDAEGNLYNAGQEITVTGSMEFTALTIEFFMEDGAAIRLSTTADESGIRFTSYINTEQLNALAGYGITNISYGTLILPYDYLDTNVKPNLDTFIVGETIIKIESTYQEEEGDYLVYRGAMRKLYTSNYERLFAGRGYMTLTFADGTTKTVYTNFDYEDNVRSVRYIAQRFQEDVEKYNDLDTKKKDVVDVYAAKDGISLMQYEQYKKNTFLNVVAWYYPELDPTNAYMNEDNDAIAQKMKDTGVKAVYLDGNYHLDLDTHVNIEKTRQIIKFFWSHGLYTIAFGSNASVNGVIDYSAKSFPDFSDCEGFIGFLVWDEPGLDKMETLANFAKNFEIVYAGTGVTYMTNLLPSYASAFNEEANWWESSLATLKVDEYKAYLEEYCTTVLSQVSGERWLSLDSYPIKADKSLKENFLFDLAMLKYYSLQYDAHAHAVLQGSGWIEDSDEMNRMPTEAELRMQAYAAMAFGVDSISWWSYSDKRGDNQQNPTDNDDYYTYFKNVNNELAAIGHIYSAFDWKGIILGVGSWSEKDAVNLVKKNLDSKYLLAASNTKNLSSVATNKTNLSYLVGVMQDMNGNEGYVLCNYNNHDGDRAQTITLTFKTNVTDVIIYRKGTNENQTETVSNKTLKITLETGEGVIVLPSKLG